MQYIVGSVLVGQESLFAGDRKGINNQNHYKPLAITSIRNFPPCLPHSSHDVSLEKLVVVPIIIP